MPTPQGCPCTRVQAALLRRRRTFHGGVRRTRPPGAHTPHPASTGGHLHGSFTLHEWRTENSNPSPCEPNRFPAGARTLTGSFSRAESGAFEAHGVNRALVSREAQGPAWFTLQNRGTRQRSLGADRQSGVEPSSLTICPECAGRGSNPHARRHWFLGPARLPISPPALGAATGNRTWVFTMAR